MNRTQRIFLEIILTLIVFSLISAMPLISRTEPVSRVVSNSASIGLTDANSAVHESIWAFGIALVGLVVIVRRKAT